MRITFRHRLFLAPAMAALTLGGFGVAASQTQGESAAVTGHVLRPKQVPPSPDLVASLVVPDGFRISKFAEGLNDPRIIAVSKRGDVYVTSRKGENCILLRDTNGDGVADVQREVASNDHLHGIALHGDDAYFVGVHEVWKAPILPDGSLGKLKAIIKTLPDAGQHHNRTLAVGPDNRLYISVGSTCNECDEPNPYNATMLTAKLDGSDLKIHASGLRNTIGFDWNPGSKQLWGMDHGIDWLGDNEQKEELNQIAKGKRYGWPYVYSQDKINPIRNPLTRGVTRAQWQAESEEPAMEYTAHAAPMQTMFYRGSQFPAEWKGDALVTMHGSWNRRPSSGYEVVRVQFDDRGKPEKISPVVTGFLREGDGVEQFGRPVGLATLRDGSVLIGDDANGVVYRLSYEPQGTRALRFLGLDTTKLTRDLVSPPAELKVSSQTFQHERTIPRKYTDYGSGISPALRWDGSPQGTKSIVLMMEDPDAAAPKPFVHWMVANLPPSGGLKEGATPLLQGSASNGKVGYYGPRPPKGDPPHRYHFQFFALDTVLDLKPGFTRLAAIQAMEGHVIGEGTVVGKAGG